MYDYMLDESKTNLAWIFGLGVNPLNAVAEMKFVQYVYGYYNLYHEYKQVIFSFDEGLLADGNLIKEICMRIGQALILDCRQVLGAIHGINTSRIHCHYMINYVGIDGSLLRQKYSVVHYKKLVNEILLEYEFTPVYYFENDKKQWSSGYTTPLLNTNMRWLQ